MFAEIRVVVEAAECGIGATMVRARGRDPDGCCPSCGHRSVRVRDRNQRQAQDVPLVARRVQILLEIRRFGANKQFHLWLNLCKTVEKCVVAHRHCLVPPKETGQDEAVAAPTALVIEGKRAANNRRHFSAVHAMYDKGVAIQVIAETLRMDRKTFRKYAHATGRRPSPVWAAPGRLEAAGVDRVPQCALAGGLHRQRTSLR
ncbi:transposase family protein [Streptomyces melanogenes]|uniref:transposase family protein n=1 Tax=Streptomyces melanogenes TaxID=67326 RepID=UPI00379C80DF